MSQGYEKIRPKSSNMFPIVHKAEIIYIRDYVEFLERQVF